jgi:hypothetical protein
MVKARRITGLLLVWTAPDETLNQTVRLPRCLNAASYSGRFVTRYRARLNMREPVDALDTNARKSRCRRPVKGLGEG